MESTPCAILSSPCAAVQPLPLHAASWTPALVPPLGSLLSSTLLWRLSLSAFSITAVVGESVFVGLPLRSGHGPFAGVAGQGAVSGCQRLGVTAGSSFVVPRTPRPCTPPIPSRVQLAIPAPLGSPAAKRGFLPPPGDRHRPSLTHGSAIAALFVRVTHPWPSERRRRGGVQWGGSGALRDTALPWGPGMMCWHQCHRRTPRPSRCQGRMLSSLCACWGEAAVAAAALFSPTSPERVPRVPDVHRWEGCC